MSKTKLKYICQNCNYEAYKWIGKCPECLNWNSFSEELIAKKIAPDSKASNSNRPSQISQIEKIAFKKTKTGIKEFDRVLGGGITTGSLILIGGEPGIGKSTLLSEVIGELTKKEGEKILYISGEESLTQVATRMRRLKVNSDKLLIYNETNLQNIIIQLKKTKPKFIVLDSIQTTVSSEIQSAPGTISQIREVTYEILNYTKSNNITAFIVGHITKDGNIAGPKILEHMVDTVIYFEGDQYGQYRMLRVIKNRFGNTNEVGIFEMRENGLKEVRNPSQYFLDEGTEKTFGKSISCILEGTRPLLLETQALVIKNQYGNGRRTTQGFDNNRLSMLIAILEKYCDIELTSSDVYVNVVGNKKISGRECDLSVMASILSSKTKIAIDTRTVFIGEVGLTGEIKSIPRVEARIKEMEHLNYKRLITSKKIEKEYKNIYKKLEFISMEKAEELSQLFKK